MFCHRLVGAASTKDAPDSSRQNVDVQPDRPVANVVAVVRLLFVDVAGATNGDLPQSADTWTDPVPQLLEFRREHLDVIVRERARTDEAHFAHYDGAQLRQ